MKAQHTSRRSYRYGIRAAVLSIILVGGCGQKGPLFLPGDSSQSETELPELPELPELAPRDAKASGDEGGGKEDAAEETPATADKDDGAEE